MRSKIVRGLVCASVLLAVVLAGGCRTLGDKDGDGIKRRDDNCPDAPEDMDGVDDDDGCPEDAGGNIATPSTGSGGGDGGGGGDRDGDGLTDGVDGCPDVPEDRDGFTDDDGCPDPDNDQDGAMDAVDRCPNEPGGAANGGCPGS